MDQPVLETLDIFVCEMNVKSIILSNDVGHGEQAQDYLSPQFKHMIFYIFIITLAAAMKTVISDDLD